MRRSIITVQDGNFSAKVWNQTDCDAIVATIDHLNKYPGLDVCTVPIQTLFIQDVCHSLAIQSRLCALSVTPVT